jgi:TrmH family RNA methyltransferase
MNSQTLNRFKLLLVGTKIPENIGGVARLLENYSVGEAGLVAPKCEWRTGVAQWMATWPSIDRLNSIPVYETLQDAISDCNYVVGFTARAGKTRKLSLKLENLSEKLNGKVALVFGREDFCLLKEEVELCTHLCALDSNPQFPALNLSHSVAVVLSQLYLQENNSRKGHHGLATTAQMEPMFTHLKESMVEAGLTKEGNPERMLIKLRKIFQRADLRPDDVSVLRGYFTRVIAKINELKKD